MYITFPSLPPIHSFSFRPISIYWHDSKIVIVFNEFSLWLNNDFLSVPSLGAHLYMCIVK